MAVAVFSTQSHAWTPSFELVQRELFSAVGAQANAWADADNVFKVRPIHSAAAVRDRTSVRLLLEAGADPNVRQQGGYTPLHTAAQQPGR